MAFQNRWGRTLKNFISGYFPPDLLFFFFPLPHEADCSVCYYMPQKSKSRCWDSWKMPILLLLNLAFLSPVWSFLFLFHKSQLKPFLPPFQPSLSPVAFRNTWRKTPPMPVPSGILNPRTDILCSPIRTPCLTSETCSRNTHTGASHPQFLVESRERNGHQKAQLIPHQVYAFKEVPYLAD